MSMETINNPPTGYSRRTTYVVIFVALAIIGAWAFYTQPGVLGKADSVGYAICHRIEARSFEAFGRALPLCARCTGIYLGVMTGLGVYAASGRGRSGVLPNWRVGLVMMTFVGVMGVDGLNSYFHLFPGYDGPYQPQNWLRLLTGVFTGLTLITLVLPIFNQSMWQDMGTRTPPVNNFKELAGLSVLALIMVALMLSYNATIQVFLGVVSAMGVVIVLTMIMTVMVVTSTLRFRTFENWREAFVPILAGLSMAILMIALINLARFTFTGTWEGFAL